MIRPMQHIVIVAPPIVLTRNEIDTLVGVLADSLEATAKDLAAEGVWARLRHSVRPSQNPFIPESG